jgi:hypothetical protein
MRLDGRASFPMVWRNRHRPDVLGTSLAIVTQHGAMIPRQRHHPESGSQQTIARRRLAGAVLLGVPRPGAARHHRRLHIPPHAWTIAATGHHG